MKLTLTSLMSLNVLHFSIVKSDKSEYLAQTPTFKATIVPIDLSKHAYQQTIEIQAGLNNDYEVATIIVENNFLFIIEDDNYKTMSKEETLIFAEVFQMCISHTRALFAQKTKGTKFEQLHIRIEWMSKLRELIKEAYSSLNN